jgi:hypothetical protein
MHCSKWQLCSITSSAGEQRRRQGEADPLAALTLIASWHLVGCLIGKSAFPEYFCRQASCRFLLP